MYHIKLEENNAEDGIRKIDKIVSIPELEQIVGKNCKNTIMAFCDSRGDVLEFTSPSQLYHFRVERM